MLASARSRSTARLSAPPRVLSLHAFGGPGRGVLSPVARFTHSIWKTAKGADAQPGRRDLCWLVRQSGCVILFHRFLQMIPFCSFPHLFRETRYCLLLSIAEMLCSCFAFFLDREKESLFATITPTKKASIRHEIEMNTGDGSMKTA